MIPIDCNACGKPLLLANANVDDGCPCNSPRGANFTPRVCEYCDAPDCVKPAHRAWASAIANALDAVRGCFSEVDYAKPLDPQARSAVAVHIRERMKRAAHLQLTGEPAPDRGDSEGRSAAGAACDPSRGKCGRYACPRCYP